MEHTTKETIFDELNNFEKKKPFDVPVILDEYLNFIAKTGDIIFPWSKLKPLFKCKLDRVIRKFKEDYPVEDMPYSPNIEKFNFEDMHTKLLNTLEEFTGAPFTIQRLCELVVHPDKHYKRIDKFLRALEKDLLVVSTVEPINRRSIVDCVNSSVMNGVSETVFNSVNGVTPGSPSQTPFHEVTAETPVESSAFKDELDKLGNESEALDSERKENNNSVQREGDEILYSAVETCVSSSSSSADSDERGDTNDNDGHFDKRRDGEVVLFMGKEAVEVDVLNCSDATATQISNVDDNGGLAISDQRECLDESIPDSNSRSDFESGLPISSIQESNHDSNLNPINSQHLDSASVSSTTFSAGYGDSHERITDLEPMEQD